MIDITKETKAVLRWASDDASRPNLETVNFDADGVQYATNGHGLAIYSHENRANLEDVPTIAGFEPSANGHPVLLRAESVESIIKALPKRSVVQVLSHAVGGTETDNTVAVAVVGSETVFNAKKELGEFPDVNVIIPQGEPTISFGISVEYLARVAASAKDIGATAVRLDIFDADGSGPMKFTGYSSQDQAPAGNLQIILMPCRL